MINFLNLYKYLYGAVYQSTLLYHLSQTQREPCSLVQSEMNRYLHRVLISGYGVSNHENQ